MSQDTQNLPPAAAAGPDGASPDGDRPDGDRPGVGLLPSRPGSRLLRALSAPLAPRAFEFWAYQYRRTWRAGLMTTLVGPVLFLAAMGVGLGSLVNRSRGGVQGVDYLVFLAPGMLAAAAMQTGIVESTWPVLGAIKWFKTYLAMIATPLGPTDVLVGHLMWIAVRLIGGSTAYLGVMALFGAVRSPLALLALPAAVLTGLAFASPTVSFSVARENDAGFAALFRFGVTPLFLFSGTFFPVSQLPVGLEQVAYLTPLWHGVDLCRSLCLGTATPGRSALHVAYLTVLALAGLPLARRAYHRRLVV
jgi:lipooligosaccharide transport system permease protein